jgi:hypothetical protein
MARWSVRSRASDRLGWRLETGERSVTCSDYLSFRAACSSLHTGLIAIHHLRPAMVAQSRGFLSRADLAAIV